MKRILDAVISSMALVVLAVPMAGISAAIRLSLGRPVLFRQVRTGRGGHLFVLYKYRTMRNDMDEKGELLPDEARLPSFGRFLRRTSLDELPELFNIIGGDMSLVGPRPLLPQYLERYSPEQARRHEVKPGLTGWAQVNGRNALSWEQKFTLDVWYVDNWSLRLDLKILAMTTVSWFKGDGVSATDHATMPEFMGTPPSEQES